MANKFATTSIPKMCGPLLLSLMLPSMRRGLQHWYGNETVADPQFSDHNQLPVANSVTITPTRIVPVTTSRYYSDLTKMRQHYPAETFRFRFCSVPNPADCCSLANPFPLKFEA
ncbi:MAG: hypothetical protein U0930_24140 [Pirellulales bacterium]